MADPRKSLTDHLALDMDAIRPDAGGVQPAQFLAHAQALEHGRQWCRRALAQTHLVAVAAHLTDRFHLDLAGLEALGVPVDLLREFPDWRRGTGAGFRPQPSGLRPSPAGAGESIGTLRLQLSPASGTIPYAFSLLRDLLRRLDDGVRVVVVVEPAADMGALRNLAREFFSRRAAVDLRFAELRCVSVFAQDNARSARDAAGQTVLMIPRAFRRGSDREGDELAPADAERAFGVPVVRSRLLWEGGNIVSDGHQCLVGVDTIAENMTRFGLTAAETRALLSADLGAEVRLLGDLDRARFDHEKDAMSESGQAAFHIDLDVTLLGRFGRSRAPRALVADAARGLEFLPAVLAKRSLFTGRFLPADRAREYIGAEYEAYARQRHPRLLAYAATLEQLGYRVFGMPDLRIDPMENVFASTNLDFGYCNVLPGLRRGRPAVHYLTWGVPTLDRAAAARFQAAGVEPIRIGTPEVANALMRLHGGLHCFCGTLG